MYDYVFSKICIIQQKWTMFGLSSQVWKSPCAAGTDAVAQCDNDPMDMAGVPR